MTSPDDLAMWRERMGKVAAFDDKVDLFAPCQTNPLWKCEDCPAYVEGKTCQEAAAAYLEHDKEATQ